MPNGAPEVTSDDGCVEKVRLLHTYKVAASDYLRAVQVLSERSGVMSKADYTRVREYSEQARKKAEVARYLLDWHISKHGC